MIQSMKLLGILHCQHILHILHHADDRGIAPGIGTDGAHLGITDIMAHTTVLHLALHAGDGIHKLIHIPLLPTEHKKHKAQSCLAPYTRQLGKLSHCLFQ